MKKIVSSLATLLFLPLMVVGFAAAPAHADVCTFDTGLYCGVMKHYTPDDGYDRAIKIECNFGSGDTHQLAEGESSTKYCKDMDRFYIRDGEELWCKYRLYNGDTYQYYDKWLKHADGDATGWHKWSNGESDGYGCTLHAD